MVGFSPLIYIHEERCRVDLQRYLIRFAVLANGMTVHGTSTFID